MTGVWKRVSRERLAGELAVKGGREGLFIPDAMECLRNRNPGFGAAGGGIVDSDAPKPPRPLLIAEGPTDAAALLDLGFDAVGRPSEHEGSSPCLS